MKEKLPDSALEAPLSDRLTRLSLAALFASVFSFCISVGGLTPLLALVMEGQGVDGAVIGLVVAAQPIGTIIAAPLVPALLRRLGTADTILICGAFSILTTALFPVFTSVPAWLALRLVAGLASAAPWVVVETWINAVATSGERGRTMALYGSVMAAGFAIGPVLLIGMGSEGAFPFIAFAIGEAISLVPILLTRRLAPRLEVDRKPAYRRILGAAPTLFAAAVLAGAVDIAFFSFLPIWGLRNGLEDTFAVTLLTVFVAGNIFLQYPLGWFADTCGYRSGMVVCGVICLLAPLAAPQLTGQPFVLMALLFVWGGAAWGVYSIALAALGVRFRGASLAAANAVFVIAFELANIAGPPLAGGALDLWPRQGLMAIMAVFGAAFLLIVLFRVARDHILEDPKS